MCLWLCTTSVHNTTQNSSDNLPSYLQTNIIAQMLSIGWEGYTRAELPCTRQHQMKCQTLKVIKTTVYDDDDICHTMVQVTNAGYVTWYFCRKVMKTASKMQKYLDTRDRQGQTGVRQSGDRLYAGILYTSKHECTVDIAWWCIPILRHKSCWDSTGCRYCLFDKHGLRCSGGQIGLRFECIRSG